MAGGFDCVVCGAPATVFSGDNHQVGHRDGYVEWECRARNTYCAAHAKPGMTHYLDGRTETGKRCHPIAKYPTPERLARLSRPA